MAWHPDAPLDALNKAAFVFFEVCGYDDYLQWLDQERSRVRVILGLQQRYRDSAAVVPGIAQEPAVDVDPLLEALSFYGDASHYQPGRNGRPSKVQQDAGAMAREAMEDFGRAEDGDER